MASFLKAAEKRWNRERKGKRGGEKNLRERYVRTRLDRLEVWADGEREVESGKEGGREGGKERGGKSVSMFMWL